MASIKAVAQPQPQTRPVLKWAGGKTQLLTELSSKIPATFNKYIEPFFGGGALYFNLTPQNAVISDLNPELVNLYQVLAENPQAIISRLAKYKNDERFFYELRSKDFKLLNKFDAAARTIFLNKTCFNGLYRVNGQGKFNVPYGRYKNPKFYDEAGLLNASQALQNCIIETGDYKSILKKHAKKGDFIFLDPPYLPISQFADFKRYTKEQFYEEDHRDLAAEVKRLQEIGCHVILTNSNHPLVHDLYSDYQIEVVKTKRYINCNAENRIGEDVIVTVLPKEKASLKVVPEALPDQVSLYPSTRWMGSKSKLLDAIYAATKDFEFDSVLDLFSGSGIVGYMFKSLGKQVTSNDYMALSATYSKAMIENNNVTLSIDKAKKLLLKPQCRFNDFVQTTFGELYFTSEENLLIDIIRANIRTLRNEYEKAIAMSGLIRACFKKRPRGIFTYVGHRYDDGRKDLQISLSDHFLRAVSEINASIFSNDKKNASQQKDSMSVRKKSDLIYIDPPYFSPLSDNEYVRRYHFC